MKIDNAALTTLLTTSVEAARLAVIGTDDGGTCNMDSVVLDTGKRKSAKTLAAIEASGCGCYHRTGYGYVISCRAGGQGYSRTAAVRLIVADLRAAGYEAGVHYVTD
jgi:hypothetical protein